MKYRQINGQEANQYDIGGVCVTMNDEQAAAWNAGTINREIADGAYVSVPMRSGGSSVLVDGEVVVNDGLPHEDFVPLWDYIGGDDGESDAYVQHMDGRQAVMTKD